MLPSRNTKLLLIDKVFHNKFDNIFNNIALRLLFEGCVFDTLSQAINVKFYNITIMLVG